MKKSNELLKGFQLGKRSIKRLTATCSKAGKIYLAGIARTGIFE